MVVPHYAGIADTLACLKALEGLGRPVGRMIVVANGEEPLEPLLTSWRGLTDRMARPAPALVMEGEPLPGSCRLLLGPPRHRGFAGGCNAGLALALADPGCQALWLLNSDARPAPDALNALCRRLGERPRAGFCGSLLAYAHAPDTVQCAGGGLISAWTGATAFCRGGAATVHVSREPAARVEACLDYLCGASLLARREAVEMIGPLDAAYFLYYEDVEWCLRARRAGWDLAFAPNSVVFHQEGGASGARGSRGGRPPRRSRLVDYLCLRNRIRLMRDFYPFRSPVALAGCLGVMTRRLVRGEGDRLGLVLRAAWAGLAGPMGRPDPERYLGGEIP